MSGYLIGWTGPFNSMDGSAELVGFMRTLMIAKDETEVKTEVENFKERMIEDSGMEEFDERIEDGWTIITYSDCAWIAYKEI